MCVCLASKDLENGLLEAGCQGDRVQGPVKTTHEISQLNAMVLFVAVGSDALGFGGCFEAIHGEDHVILAHRD